MTIRGGKKLEALLRALGLLGELVSSYDEQDDKFADSVLVAIDFENTEPLKQKNLPPDLNTQVGLAVLDTRDLRKSVPPDQLISTYNFVCGSPSYVRKAFSKFIFGIPVKIEPDALLTSIVSSIPKDRNIIFVGHNVRVESRILSRLGFNHQKMNVLTHLDTFQLSAKVVSFWALKLHELLNVLDCSYGSYDWLHNGGNDANFSLRAVLLLAVRYMHRRGHSGDRLDYLTAVGHLPLPSQPPGLPRTIADRGLATAEARRLRKTRKRIEEAIKTIGHLRKHVSEAVAGERVGENDFSSLPDLPNELPQEPSEKANNQIDFATLHSTVSSVAEASNLDFCEHPIEVECSVG